MTTGISHAQAAEDVQMSTPHASQQNLNFLFRVSHNGYFCERAQRHGFLISRQGQWGLFRQYWKSANFRLAMPL